MKHHPARVARNEGGGLKRLRDFIVTLEGDRNAVDDLAQNPA
jgi:hypothetical protein